MVEETQLAATSISNTRWLQGAGVKNAYGEFLRSGAMEEIMEKLPMLTGLMKSELQNGCVNFWQKIKGEWMNSEAWRGGYQGKRLITIMFCCSLIRVERQCREMGEPGKHESLDYVFVSERCRNATNEMRNCRQ